MKDATREALLVVADLLIPGGQGMPSARAAGVGDGLVDRVLAVRPAAAAGLDEALGSLAAALEACRGVEAPQAIEHLQQAAPGSFRLVASVLVGAYFLDQRVRLSIRYPGQGPTETTYEDETGYITSGLLDPVLERGLPTPVG